ncbi:sodium:proton antiporter [Fibrobacterales bacterium]|nr:sodium:proton antiporter [Fibrobacterales bacterium]
MTLTIIAIIFVLGYLAIALEHPLKINKTASALFLGTLLWLIWFSSAATGGEEAIHATGHQLFESFGELAQILFFLMGAMTIVAIIEKNDGFSIITNRIETANVRTLMWVLSWIAFFFSAILDNLTTTIVMVTLSRKLISDKTARLYFAGLIIIAANAGGAWSPIGDVTTTMLWIGGQISADGIIHATFLASVFSLLVPLVILTFFLKGSVSRTEQQSKVEEIKPTAFERNALFAFGLGGLLMVPIIKTVFHVPPYIAMLFSLGIVWAVVDILKRKHGDKTPPRLLLHHVIKDVDNSSLLFFVGILLAVGVLGATGQLEYLAKVLETSIGDIRVITFSVGILSAIVDNVPLVAATMKMYSLQTFPQDHLLWEFIAFCAGTGGSMLVIGSAAGVAAMGIDKRLSFGWYLKHITPLAFAGYVAGALVYLLQRGAL